MAGVRREEVLRYLGYGGQAIDASLDARIDELCARCASELEPRFTWRVFDVAPRARDERGACGACDAFEVAGTTLLLEGASMASYLAGASRVALVACTLGARSEAALRLLGATDPLGQLVYDAACTDLVEQGADQAEAQVAAYARERGLRCGMRYGPGYGDLDLAVQPVILDVLQTPKLLGLTATAQHLLVPAKSTTAIIGLYPEAARPEEAAPGGDLLGCGPCFLRASCQIRARGGCCHRPRVP